MPGSVEVVANRNSIYMQQLKAMAIGPKPILKNSAEPHLAWLLRYSDRLTSSLT